jgi:hypothetical protein
MLLSSGQVVSAVGSEITYVAYPLLVLALTQSPAIVSTAKPQSTGDSHSDSHRDAAGKADGGPRPAV